MKWGALNESGVMIFTLYLDYYTPLPRDLLTCAAALTISPFHDSYCTILTRLD